jgi:magnesium-transporting ATPase (P-type)
MIKEASRDNVTAAIGDGGNDISMIQGKMIFFYVSR